MSEVFRHVDATPDGLSSEQVQERLSRLGPNVTTARHSFPRVRLALNQVRSPIALLLMVAALLSAWVGDTIEGSIILGILVVSSILSYLQELRAHNAVNDLLAKLEHRSEVLRDGAWKEVPISEVVPGDTITLSAGAQVPADCRILEGKDLFVDQSALTGESFPSAKETVDVVASAPLSERMNALFAGTHVVSGSATGVVVLTGRNTEFGHLVQAVGATPPLTEFQLGVRHFGYLLLEVAGAMAILSLAINLGYGRPTLDTLLFTLALVVGMTPQLLPAIVTATLAQGARRLAKGNAIVRRLTSIADIGGVRILCTDKTGTLTKGAVSLEKALGCDGTESAEVALYGYLNARHESGYANVLDNALRELHLDGADEYEKLDEVPYDFTRKRLSVLLRGRNGALMITKGAFREILSICSRGVSSCQGTVPIEKLRDEVSSRFEGLSKEGYRVIGVAHKEFPSNQPLRHDDENDMTFDGFLAFLDPPEVNAIESVQALERYGIECKMITGDNRFVAANVASRLGVLSPDALITGSEVDQLAERALMSRVREVDIFAEVGPNQKERIIRALKRTNLGVAYLGDGINDAAALRSADVGISVESAVDATKEAADIVLVTKDLKILLDAVVEGRRAFGNTLKYILISTSANFGNMFSVVGASLFADFLPLLPSQILLLNVLSDLPAMSLAADKVDPEMVARPLRWNMKEISRAMVVYGGVSSVYDYMTFGTLLIMGASAAVFRTGWFLESLISEVFVLLVIRTQRPFWRSSVGEGLLSLSVFVVLLAVALPYTIFAVPLGLTPIPASYGAVIVVIVVAYVVSSEGAKAWLNRGKGRSPDERRGSRRVRVPLDTCNANLPGI